MTDGTRGPEQPAPIETVLVNTPLVTIGRFRLEAAHRDFQTLGAISRHCFVFPRRAVWIQHRDQAPFVADPTRVPLYNPAAEYRRERIDPVGDHCEWYGVAADVVRQVVGRWDPAAAEADVAIFRRSHASVSSKLYLSQRRLYHYVRQTDRPDLLYVEEAVLNLLADVVACSARIPDGGTARDPGRRRRQQHAAAEAACADLNRCFWRSDSLSAIAGRVGVSVFHLCRLFRRATGGTIHQHREQLRLRASLHAVMDTDEDLLSIALRLGYSGHSHFTAAFRRCFSLTPSALRRGRRTNSVTRDLLRKLDTQVRPRLSKAAEIS